MLKPLSTRLLASYVAVILITLCLIGFTLLIFLRTSPLPTDEIVNDLAATLLDIRSTESIRTAQAETLPGETPSERAVRYLIEEANAREVRVLLITNAGQVLFDSDETFIPGTLVKSTERLPLIPAGRAPRETTVFQGRFVDPDRREWIYVAQPLRPFLELQPTTANLVVARPLPRATLREVFRLFGDVFFSPLLRAGAIGLLVALLLAFLISRSVAKPLQQMSHAAQQIANGDFNQRVPVEGPQEVQSLAVSFNEMVDRVAATQQAQRDFLANVSHDLRTPLTSIQGFSQAIAEGVTSDPDSARHAAQIIHDEAGRMHRMVEELLDLARLEAGRLNMHRQSVRVGEVLRTVGESLSVKARERGVNLHVEVPPELPRLAGDGDRLAQVFTNLLDNAIRHTPSGGRVGLRAETNGSWLVVTVSDTGEGIPAADLPRVFERFYQVDKSRQRDRGSGMGLGLAITKQIIEAHGGSIQVTSTVGEGTTFVVYLPLAAPDSSTITARRS